MNIIILGAGQVGGTLAESLAREHNDITIVDTKPHLLAELQNRLDIRTVEGAASNPDVLAMAGAEFADMLIAVTDCDEVNMIACEVAQAIFSVPTKIARIRDRDYLKYPQLFDAKAIPIDEIISPEELVTRFVARLIEHPGALQVLDFADGRVKLVAVRPGRGGFLVGKSISEVMDSLPAVEMKIAAIFRDNTSLSLSSDTCIEVGDEVFFLATPQHIQQILMALGRLENANKRIMIVGGGHIGSQLAQSLESQFQVKLIERSAERTQYLSELLHHTTVLLGDAADRELLINENIEFVDVFVAVTNDDEANIMSCMQAKRLGVHHVMALINRPAYVELIEGGLIDTAISPQQITIGAILTRLRRGDIENVYSLRRGAAEAIEVIAHGDYETSKVVGRSLSEIHLPSGSTIGAIVRGEEVFMAEPEVVLQAEDHVIIFVDNKKNIHQVEQLFQVTFGYF